MIVRFLSSKEYSDPSGNKGDCIVIDTGSNLVIYDCGCEEHAEDVIAYMKQHNYNKAKVILSHNDDDHFLGIPRLIEEGLVDEIYTLKLLDYKSELKRKIKVNPIKEETLERRIKEIFDNIYSLETEEVKLKDIFIDTYVCPDVTIVGPDKEYALEAIAKLIDSGQGDTIDKETIVNAVSTQVRVNIGARKLLLCGDSNFEAIKDKLSQYTFIQLPHHGKLEQANSIFEARGSAGVVYYVSDNTGDSNAGSDNLPESGYDIFNTKDGEQVCDRATILRIAPVSTLYRGI